MSNAAKAGTALASEPRKPVIDHSPATQGGGPPTGVVPPASDGTLSQCERFRADAACNNIVAPGNVPCVGHLKIAFFFDGTGNNLKADTPTLEHSNVVRLYRAHPEDDIGKGIYRRYVPGLGTPFPEIGDKGGRLGAGVGLYGEQRLDWAFDELAQIVKDGTGACKKLTMISISAFGFSRGAALARAFLTRMVDGDKAPCSRSGDKLVYKAGNVPLEIRFVGLWDTVASVGTPMSANNINNYRQRRRWGKNLLRSPVLSQFADLTTAGLAFGPPGADPSPGSKDGHLDWGGQMKLLDGVIGQCVHMVAAHEQRNAFPLDSALEGARPPRSTVELPYPGVHSNVGGGYRPGEGGRAEAMPANTDDGQQGMLMLSQIPLNEMYRRALQAGVPLLTPGSDAWAQVNTRDFAVHPKMMELFNHYISQVRADGLPLGDAFLAHMRMYFAWRFQHIRKGGRKGETAHIEKNEKVWQEDKEKLQREKAALEAKADALRREMGRLLMLANNQPKQRLQIQARYAAAQRELADADQAIVEVDARIETLPTIDTLNESLTEHDAEFIGDVRRLYDMVKEDSAKRANLRPHYRNLVQAYENEYIKNQGMRDANLIAFFDNFVHDSVADFSSDSTLATDPRVIYVGGDTKMRYSMRSEPAWEDPGLVMQS